MIRTVEELRALLGTPNPAVPRKIHRQLNRAARDFIARSPLLLMATCDASGTPTVSPKGDDPGFVKVEPDESLLIPERKGNRLLFSLINLLANPRVALIFLVPGTDETLRVAGEAVLDDDPALRDRLHARNAPALLVTRVRVTECYFHCAKAFLRSRLWAPDTWPDRVAVSFGQEICEEGGLQPTEVEAFDAAVQNRYRIDL
jgi:PPOX class probable FMN-dependent enzyme